MLSGCFYVIIIYMTITVQDVVNTMDDHLGNYTTGQNDTTIKIRAISRALDHIKNQMGLPCDELKHEILFSEDNYYYDCPADFVETLGVYYTDDDNNVVLNEWTYLPWVQLKRKLGSPSSKKYFSYYPVNGKNQLILFGSNLKGAQVKDGFESLWAASGDASNVTLDGNQKKEGLYSNNFDITNSSGTATLTLTNLTWDVRELHEKLGYWKVWTYLTSTVLDGISIEYGTDSSNYYTITTTLKDDGTAFTNNDWNKLGFSTNSKIMTGSPDDSNITYVKFHYDLGSGFTSATDFRLDWLTWTFPDKIDHVYYTSIKGTDTTGTTDKTQLTELSDILSFGSFAEDLINPIALKAAIYLAPSMRGDINFYQLYKQDYVDVIKLWSRRYPRKRIQNNHFTTKLRR